MAGVSIGTVDRALHGRPGINEETRNRVLEVAKKIGYRPNLAARSLSTRKRIRIGVCVPREIRYFYNQMWEGISRKFAGIPIAESNFYFSRFLSLAKASARRFDTCSIQTCKASWSLLGIRKR